MCINRKIATNVELPTSIIENKEKTNVILKKKLKARFILKNSGKWKLATSFKIRKSYRKIQKSLE